MRRASLVIPAIAIVLVGAALFSYWSAGFVYLLASGTPDQATWLDRVKDTVHGWGRLAPVLFTLAVVIEVIVAPIPGALLYAPGGAIFGAFWGGTLALIGNVIGAAICCVLGRMIGERVIGAQAQSSPFVRYRERLADRGLWVVLLLRANPLTSSDLVSYAAGVAGVPPWKVAVGTLVGLAPLCYIQAYFSEQVFTLVPGRVLLILGIAILVAVLVIVAKGTSAER